MKPIHPGHILKTNYIEKLSLNQSQVAEGLKISYKHLSNILNGKAQISAIVAVKLSIAFNTSPQFWLSLQNELNISIASEKLKGIDIKVFS